jgi:NADH-quinone oxidoreductase subunit G
VTEVAKVTDTVTVTIDGIEVQAQKGALLIRVAEKMGIDIPRFCDHPLLAPAGACRQCLVEVEGQRKPVASCTQPVADGMTVRTQRTSEVARKAQAGIMELLLINHPLDCPMCDKGGECPLQNQAMSSGRAESRFHEQKRQYAKPINLSSQVLLDRERCVLCQRCTRFSEEIAGDKFIDLMERSSVEQIGIYRQAAFGGGPEHEELDEPTYPQDRPEAGDEPFNSYFSGNTVQICPVGALTGTQYRFRARPFDLVSTPSVCEHCAAGCAQRTDHRRGKVMRRLAGEDPQVNEEWNCDKGRWGFQYQTAGDRLTTPLLRDSESGQLRPAGWPEALRHAAEGLRRARDGAYGIGVLTGGRLTVEDAFAYAKFARVALHTNDIDFRSRPVGRPGSTGHASSTGPAGSAGQAGEEAEFLAALVAASTDWAGIAWPAGNGNGSRSRPAFAPGAHGASYADLETAPVVVLAGLEPEEECPILFLRLRKAVGKRRLAVLAVTPFTTKGLAKLAATVVRTVPGAEASVLAENPALRAALSKAGAVLIVGERLATVPGGLSAAGKLAAETGARLGWVPRRAGDRGAIEAGCLPNLLPGGRLVTDPAARADLALRWKLGTGIISGSIGRDSDAIVAAAAAGRLGALVVAGVDPDDLTDPVLAGRALEQVNFLVSFEVRHSAVAARADVVFPVAPVAEKAGTFLNWEGRPRAFGRVLTTQAISDARALDALARQMGVELGCADVATIRAELTTLIGTGPTAGGSTATGGGSAGPRLAAQPLVTPEPGEAVLATWAQLIDLGRLLHGDDVLAGTARPPVVKISAATAVSLPGGGTQPGAGSIVDGDMVRVSSDRGSVALPVEIADLPDGVVWLPANSPGCQVRTSLGVTEGAIVKLSRGGER